MQNTSIRSLQYRLRPPTLPQWHVSGGVGSTRLAPGLEHTVTVTFTSNVISEIIDKLVVETTGARFEVPLHAHGPKPDVTLEGSFDLGVIAVDRPFVKALQLRNHGIKGGTILAKLNPPIPGLVPSLSSDWIEAKGHGKGGDVVDVVLNVRPDEPGLIQTQLTLSFGEDVTPIVMDVVGEAVNHELRFETVEGAPLDQLRLGPMYAGTRIERAVTLFNAGPRRVGYAAYTLGAQEASRLVVKGEITDMEEVKAAVMPPGLSITPTMGSIGPFERTTVMVTYTPPEDKQQVGFTTTLASTFPGDADRQKYALVLASDTRNQLPAVTLPMILAPARPGLLVEPKEVTFGSITVGQTVSEVVRFTNLSTTLPLRVHVEPRGAFRAERERLELLPSETVSMLVHYMPRSMGTHAQDVSCVLRDASGVFELERSLLTLVGEALTHGVTEKAARGKPVVPAAVAPLKMKPTALGTTVPRIVPPLPEDYAAQLARTTAPHPGPLTGKTPARTHTELEPEASRQAFLAKYPEAGTHQYSLSFEQTQKRSANRAKYDTMLADAAKERRYQARREASQAPGVTTKATDPISLGLAQRAGMREPKIGLPEFKDPLFLTDGGQVRPKPRAPLPDDPRVLARCRHKQTPVTDKEKADCNVVLIGPDLSKVQACRVLDFGRVALMQSATRHFAITNGLNHHVWAQVECPDVFTHKGGMQQVIPPGQTAAFSLTFSATVPGLMEREVGYRVNGSAFKFKAQVQSIPVSIETSVETLSFAFGPDNWSGVIEQQLAIENRFDFAVPFTIDLKPGPNHVPLVDAQGRPQNPVVPFKVLPHSGTLEPHGVQTLTVHWNPSELEQSMGGRYKYVMEVHTKGETKVKTVTLVTDIPKGRMQVAKDTLIDLGTAAVGSPTAQSVTLRNMASVEGQYAVRAASKMLKCTSAFGRVPPKGSAQIEVELMASSPCELNEMLTFQIRGGRPVKVPLKAKVVVPDLHYETNSLDFGPVIVGASAKRDITIVNGSAVQGHTVMDLAEFRDVSVELAREAWNSDQYPRCPLEMLRDVLSQERSGAGTVASEASLSAYSDRSSVRREPSGASQGSGSITTFPAGQKVRITLPAHGRLVLSLVYRPSVVGPVTSQLRLVSATGGPPLRDSRMSRPLSLSVMGLEPRVVVSDTMIDFGRHVALRGSGQTSYVQKITLSSKTTEKVSFRFDAEELCDADNAAVFSMEPSSGTIEPGAPFEVKVHFMPQAARHYGIRVPLYLDGEKTVRYLELALSGLGSTPKLLFDTSHVLLEPVPLGVPSHACVMVVNDGYANLDFKVKMPVDSEKVPIQVDFPEGTMLGVAKSRLPMMITCLSDKPVSFSSTVTLIDHEGTEYTITVSGICENCLLTTSAFMDRHRRSVKVVRRDDGTLGLELKPMYEAEEACGVEIANIGNIEESLMLKRFITATSMLGPFASLQAEAVTGRGRLLFDIVQLLSGRSLPGRVGSLPANRKDALNALCGQFKHALQHMTTLGATLSNVHPEFLMPSDDFTRLLSVRADDEELERSVEMADGGLSFWETIESNFTATSVRAWNTVFDQVAKTYVTSRVSSKSLKALGVPVTKEMERAWGGSSVYSVQECALLAWVQHHYDSVFTHPRWAYDIVCFDESFESMLPLAAVLISHWPGLADLRERLSAEGHAAANLQNAGVVTQAMTHLGLPLSITPQELVSLRPRDMMLLCTYFFNVLPQYKPIATLEFTGTLGEPLTKHVELNNPSGNTVVYKVRIEGDANFTLSEPVVTLAPRSKLHYAITCMNTIAKPCVGTLVFTSKRDGTAQGTALVFNLQAMVDVLRPIQSAEMQGTTYTLDTFEVMVTNPFAQDCEFSIQLIQEFMSATRPRRGLQQGTATSAAKSTKGPGDDRASASTTRGGAAVPASTGAASRSSAADSASTQAGKTAAKQQAAAAAEVLNEEVVTIENPDIRKVTLSPHVATPQAEHYPDAFGCERIRMRFREGATERLDLMFLPFVPGTHRCYVVLEDPKMGAFRVEVTAKALLPPPQQKIIQSIETHNPVPQDIPLGFANPQLDAAKRLFLERHPLAKVESQVARLQILDQLRNDYLVYAVERNNPLFTSAGAVLVKARVDEGDAKSKGKGGKGGNGKSGNDGAAKKSTPIKGGKDDPPPEPESNNLRVEVQPRGAGKYPGQIKLSSIVDVRIFDVTFDAVEGSTEVKLDFNCPARHSVTQEIPIHNKEEKAIQVRAIFTGDRGFTGPAQVTVEAGRLESYPLVFCAAKPGSYSAKVELNVQQTGETTVYELSGVATEPLSERNLELSLPARTEKTIRLEVPNHNTAARVEYAVLADLPFLSGAPRLEVAAGKTSTYEMVVKPVRSGKFAGAVTFMGGLGQYVWYMLDLQVLPPPASESLAVPCTVGESFALKVPVQNPNMALGAPMTFDVVYVGDAVFGPETVTVPSGASADLEFICQPLRAEKKMCEVRLSHPSVGEYRYEIAVDAAPRDPITVSPVACEVGKFQQLEVTLVNPLNRPAVFQLALGASVDDLASVNGPSPVGPWAVPATQVTIPALGETIAYVMYRPASVGQRDTCYLSAKHGTAGEWIYHMTGMGLVPGEMSPVDISAVVGLTTPTIIMWTNPFPHVVGVDLKIEEETVEDRQPALSVMLKKHTGLVCPSGGNLEIPLNFSPHELATFNAQLTLVVYPMDGLAEASVSADARKNMWRYPIHGYAEVAPMGVLYNFKTTARATVCEEVSVKLLGLGKKIPTAPFTATAEDAAGPDAEGAVTCYVSPKKDTLLHADDELVFEMQCVPTTPGSRTLTFAVAAPTGGRWRFDVKLEVGPPEAVNIIHLEAAQGSAATVPVWLTSPTSAPLPFKAMLSADTPVEFTLETPEGTLPPYGTDVHGPGVQPPIRVTYEATRYGHRQEGKLLVHTKSEQYVYMLVGSHVTGSAIRNDPGYAGFSMRPKDASVLLANGGRGTTPNFIHVNRQVLDPRSGGTGLLPVLDAPGRRQKGSPAKEPRVGGGPPPAGGTTPEASPGSPATRGAVGRRAGFSVGTAGSGAASKTSKVSVDLPSVRGTLRRSKLQMHTGDHVNAKGIWESHPEGESRDVQDMRVQMKGLGLI